MYILEVSYGCPSKNYPGNGIFQFDQAKALYKADQKIVFAAIDLRSIRRWRKWGINHFIKDDIDVYEFNFPFGPIADAIREKVGVLGFLLLFNRLIKDKGKPDIVHVHFIETAALILETCKKNNVPFVVTEHSSDLMNSNNDQRYIKKYKSVYHSAKCVIAVSSVLAYKIKEKMGIIAIVVPNIVDTSVFSYIKQLNNKRPEIHFISAGNLITRKGFDLLITAFKKVVDKYSECYLTIMGDGQEREILRYQTSELKLDRNIVFLGSYTREEFSHQLTQSDVFILASRAETFGVVYIEAMACGVPVIATQCGGPTDFVDNDTGLIVPNENTEKLADAMIYMSEHFEEYRKDLISNYAKNTFAPERIAEKLISIFERILV